MVPLAQLLDELLDETIVDDVALGRHEVALLMPDIVRKIMAATKRIVNYSNAGFYQVLSAEVGTKHGLNVSGLVLDEVHAQPNRKLYDVLTKGSGDAREQPLYFLITTAGTDKESICYELHTKALDILDGRKIDHTFYPVVYGLRDDEDWHDEANWYKANPSLGQTIQIDRVRDMYRDALDNPAEENVFKQLRLNMWVASLTRFIPEHIYELGNQPIDLEALKGRDCYAGLDLSSTGDITAFVLMFPPRTEDEKYIMLPFFWIPEDTIPLRVRRASVAPLEQCRGHLHHLVGHIENDGRLLAVGGSTVDFGRRFIICKQQIQRNSGGELGLAVLLADLHIRRAELAVTVLIHDAEHIPDDLLLPRQKPEPLARPFALGVAQVFNECHRPVCFCLIVVGSRQHEPGRLVVLQLRVVLGTCLSHQPSPPSSASISSEGPLVLSSAMMRLLAAGVRPNCSANRFMIFR